MKGIDVSTLQGGISWRRVKADGIRFAMIKATQGRGEGASTKNLRVFTDSRFKTNIKAAHNAGIDCGVYHYFTAKTNAEAEYEAEYFLEAIEPHKQYIDLWAAVDVESEPHLGGVGKTLLTSATKTFMAEVKKAGYKPMLYTNPNYLTYRFAPSAFDDYDIWLAHWGVKKPMAVPNTRIWQYGLGKVDGISTDVDMDEGYFGDGQAHEDADAQAGGKEYKVGGRYTMQAGDEYSNGKPVPDSLIGKTYTIAQVRDDRILLKEIVSWVKI